MKTMAISVFKARCLAVLEQVRRTREPLLITRFGEPVAQVTPPPVPPRSPGWLGSLKGTAQARGDLVAPAAAARDWEASGS